MEMEDLIQKIKEIYKSACKERCETCRYRMFAKRISELKMSPEVINELTQEMIEQNEYEKNRWTKIFKPVMAYVGAPVFATYMTNWIHDNFKCVSDFWLGLLITALVFIVVYILLGGGIAAIIVCIDTIKNKNKQIIRLLQKYSRELRFQNLLNHKEQDSLYFSIIK